MISFVTLIIKNTQSMFGKVIFETLALLEAFLRCLNTNGYYLLDLLHIINHKSLLKVIHIGILPKDKVLV